MKTKTKILTSTLSIAAVVGLMGYGVFAAQTPTMGTTNGAIGFNAVSVYATISGTKKDAKDQLTSDGQYAANKNYTDIKQASLDSFASWDLGALNFTEENLSYTYSITIQNDSDFAITVGYTGSSKITDDAVVVNAPAATTDIEKGAKATLTLTLTLTDVSKTLAAGQSYNFAFSLAKKSA